MALRLATKYGERILAFTDATIFHAGKGPNLHGRPYGIVPGKYQDPFSLSFSGKTAAMAPGVLSIYGRQIELDEPMAVADFTSSAETSLCYCTVYVELSMIDAVTQAASIKLDVRGAGYKDFDSTGTQEDLYPTGYGTFQAPLAQFAYDPGAASDESRFSGGLAMPIFDAESRYATRDLRAEDGINGESISNLADKESDAVLRWKKAARADLASEASSIGGNAIAGDLSGLYTVRRICLAELTAGMLEGTEESGTTSLADIPETDLAHLVAVRLYLDGGTQGKPPSARANATVGYEVHQGSGGSSGALRIGLALEDYPHELWLTTAGGMTRQTLAISGEFEGKIHTETGYTFYMTGTGRLAFGETSSGGNADLNIGDHPEGTRREYFRFVIDIGDIHSTGKASFGWYCTGSHSGTDGGYYGTLGVTSVSARLMADFIYQGDVSLT